MTKPRQRNGDHPASVAARQPTGRKGRAVVHNSSSPRSPESRWSLRNPSPGVVAFSEWAKSNLRQVCKACRKFDQPLRNLPWPFRAEEKACGPPRGGPRGGLCRESRRPRQVKNRLSRIDPDSVSRFRRGVADWESCRCPSGPAGWSLGDAETLL